MSALARPLTPKQRWALECYAGLRGSRGWGGHAFTVESLRRRGFVANSPTRYYRDAIWIDEPGVRAGHGDVRPLVRVGFLPQYDYGHGEAITFCGVQALALARYHEQVRGTDATV